MLKITRTKTTHADQYIVVEGKLLGPWVDVARSVCVPPSAPAVHTRLDLSAVTFADEAGIQLLRDLVSQGAQIVACSTYVGELLRLNNLVRYSSPPRTARSSAGTPRWTRERA